MLYDIYKLTVSQTMIKLNPPFVWPYKGFEILATKKLTSISNIS